MSKSKHKSRSAFKKSSKRRSSKAAGGGSAATKEYDHNRCATPRCKGEPSVTYEGKPLCSACWERLAAPEVNANGEAAPQGRGKRKATAKADASPKRVSALDAAAQVLRAGGKPMRSGELIVAMAEQGLWSSPNGKTPHATLYAAMLREITTKGKQSRFSKVDRGQFAYSGV